MKRIRRTFFASGVLAASLLAAPTIGHALNVTTCGTFNAATIDVGANLSQGTLNANCLVLTNTSGTTAVHLNEYRIDCANGSGCGAAITRGVGASNFIVDDTFDTPTGGIYGEWTYGIKNGGTSGVRIDGADYGIYNESAVCGSSCLTAGNVIVNCDVGIWASSTGIVHDNYVVDSTSYGIDVSSAGSAVTVQTNYVRGYGSGGVRVAASVVGASNIVDRASTSYPPTISPIVQVGGTPPAASWSTASNICEDTTWCARKAAPFFMP